MVLYILHSIFHLARLLYVRPETFGPYYVYATTPHPEGVGKSDPMLIGALLATRNKTGVA